MIPSVPWKRTFLLALLLAAPLLGQTAPVPLVPPASPGSRAGAPGSLIQLNDFGSSDIAYFSIPETSPKGGVVVLHDMWGLTDRVKAVVDRLADAGYIAVAPDLFNGALPADAERAAAMERDLPPDSARHTVAATVHFLHESPRFRCERVVVVGWGMGGALAWEAAVPVKGQPLVCGAALIGTPARLDGDAAARTPAWLLGLFEPGFPAGPRADLATGLAGRKNVELRDLPAGPPADRVWPLLLAFLDRSFQGPAPDAGNFLDRMNPFKSDASHAPAPAGTPLPASEPSP